MEQKEWLIKLAGLNAIRKKFYLTNAIEGRPGKWIPIYFWNWEQEPVFRSILQNEILIDIDGNHEEVLKKVLQRIRTRKIDAVVFQSGGRGYHVSIFIRSSLELDENGWKELREKFASRLMHGIDDLDSTRWMWRKALVRAEFASGKYCQKRQIVSPGNVHSDIVPNWINLHNIGHFEVTKKPERIAGKGKKYEVTELPMCMQVLAEMLEDGVHIEHFARVALVDYIWHCNLRPYLENDEYWIFRPHILDKCVDLFSNDPRFDAEKTTMYVNGCFQTLEKEPWKIPGRDTVKNMGWCYPNLCNTCTCRR